MRPQLVARSTVNFFLSSSLIDSIGSPSHSTGFIVVFPFIVVLFLDINSCWRVCSVVLLPHLLHSMLFSFMCSIWLEFHRPLIPGYHFMLFSTYCTDSLSTHKSDLFDSVLRPLFSIISLSLIYFRFSFSLSLSPSLTHSHSHSL